MQNKGWSQTLIGQKKLQATISKKENKSAFTQIRVQINSYV